ncbi:DUF5777 family beta-barrel protein [Tenacibaculum sp. M341]|uniref:DUF5777 family beta-barrel protein n=1 Tax=Tenacibaculum sp. M341 TaxID=2530339 RepID=UPI001048BEC6|nr:DUF5777 family beta-barrel protein [Tenacibaculum sp. M341]TCI93531.1 hypothetical protein EYW44_03745 [Tenacibaculum sp. M341]
MHYTKQVILHICFFATILFTFNLQAQDDLLDELDKEAKPNAFSLPAFKALKIGNLQSTKIAEKGDLYLIVSHRFGPLSDGFDTFFGLDNANTKIELLYSFWEGVQFSISRESFRKTFALASKIGIAKQSDKFPLNLVGYATVNRDTQLSETSFANFTLKDADRYSYSLQLLASRRFSKEFSFEIAPSFIRENLQILEQTGAANHNQFALGFGGRYKISKRVSLNAEYVYNFSRDANSVFDDPYTFGVDIETGGHVFQLLFTNAQSSNEPGFISNAGGDISFGFNIVRVF